MSSVANQLKKRALIAALASAAALGLGACGGGGGSPDAPATSGSVGATPAPSPVPAPAPAPTPTPIPTPQPVPEIGEAIVSVTLSAGAAQISESPGVTFGQVFKQGDVPAGTSVVARASGQTLATQVDWKASHADGSLRHAVISVKAPLSAGESKTVELARASAAASGAAQSAQALLDSGFKASVKAVIGGVAYTASADEALASGQGKVWLSGPVATEWLLKAPFKTASGMEHPHLTARFAVRSYGAGQARVDATVENNWAYEANPQGLLYDAELSVGGKVVYAQEGLSHYAQSRWRKVAWVGADPGVAVKHDGAYLMATRAIPNYDPSLKISEATLNGLAADLGRSQTGPMGNALVGTYMPATGGRGDIGPLPRWAALYMVSQDERAKQATLKVGDSAGSWPMHYRDKKTDLPLSVADYPYSTLLGRHGDTVNPKTKLSEAFPGCVARCGTEPFNYSTDVSHQPSMAFVPYLVTGDYFYLEELQFWAAYNAFNSNPYYREFDKGLFKSEQVRGQAWSMRTLGQTAYITPDAHPLKAQFTHMLNANLDWYNANYPNNPQANVLGALVNGYAMAYSGGRGMAPWQDDFFTWATGYVSELGFGKAAPIYAYKSKFPIGRMADPEYCWIDGAIYSLLIRDSETSPFYTSFGQAWRENVKGEGGAPLVNSTGAKYVDQACGSQAQADWRTQQDRDTKSNRNAWVAGEMTGYATSIEGYPANMQPGLAAAADSGLPKAREAWARFAGRSAKPNYAEAPQWAIVPRGQ